MTQRSQQRWNTGIKGGKAANPAKLPEYEYLHQRLNYDAISGIFLWKEPPIRKKWLEGERAGTKQNAGYRCISLKDIKYLEHRIAWKMHYGVDPNGQIDHINGERSDNRIENLRIVDFSENGMNKKCKIGKTGFQGVRFHKSRGIFYAAVKCKGTIYTSWGHKTSESARLAYLSMKKKLHGDYDRLSQSSFIAKSRD